MAEAGILKLEAIVVGSLKQIFLATSQKFSCKLSVKSFEAIWTVGAGIFALDQVFK